MWFGTRGGGLNTYDGYDFQAYRNTPGMQGCLSDNTVRSILDDQHHPDAKMGRAGNRTLASLYDLIAANAKRYNPDLSREKRTNGYDWNRAKIIVQGADVEHYLNGILVVKYNRSGPQWKELVAGSKYANWPDFGEAAKGHILLQDHGDEVHFRNIKIKIL